MWWQDAVVYQIYPRSFQDSDGDGIGDLPGIASRLEHIARLGAHAIWLSPVYPSPLADFGYDIADHCAIAPEYGSLQDLDRLADAAHERGLRVLMDLVPCHTSIEHPWFAERPELYIWDGDGDEPPNNWRGSFGGRAWSRDPLRRWGSARGRWYLHSFYREQPDLDWRHPEVAREIGRVMQFWLARGVDGFRIDALDRILKDAELRDDPPAQGPPGLPLHPEQAVYEHRYSRNTPDIGEALGALRAAAPDALLIGEVYLPTAQLAPYLEWLDLVFCFELYHAPWDATVLRRAIEAALGAGLGRGRLAWVLSNHDFQRLPNRVGRANERIAALLLLTLPGAVHVYQGDEIGLGDGPGHDPPYDRAGRDAYRHPMQWTPRGGFTTGSPWLELVDPAQRNVVDQERDRGSLLWLYRDAIALRDRLGADMRFLDAAPDVLAYTRGDAIVALNLAAQPRPAPPAGELLLRTDGPLRGGEPAGAKLAPHAGFVARAA